MKYGFQSSAYNQLTLTEELQYAEKCNCNFFDIFFDGYFPKDLTQKDYNTIMELQKKGMEYTIHYPIKWHNIPQVIKNDIFDFTKFVNAKTITIHFNEVTIEDISEILNFLNNNSSKTKLCIENTIPNETNYYLINGTKMSYVEFLGLLNNSNNIYCTLDIGHSFVTSAEKNNDGSLDISKTTENQISFINEILNQNIQIATIHAHDNDGLKDGHCVVGSKLINFSRIFSLLKDKKQNPYIVIEHWNDNYSSLKKLKEFF